MTEAVYVVDHTRTIRYWNQAAERLTGFAAADVVGRHCRDGILNHVDDDGGSLCATGCPLLHTMLDGQVRQARLYLHHAAGHRVPVDVRASALRAADGTIEGAVETFSRSAEPTPGAAWLQDLLTQAEREAATDELTGLANRRAAGRVLAKYLPDFGHRDLHGARHDLALGGVPDANPDDTHPVTSGRSIDSSAPAARCCQPSVAVLYLDVDHFKAVNDTYGHAVGDDVLRLVARTLQACARANDTVARWGGEEFVVIAPLSCPDGRAGHGALAGANAHRDAATRMAERLRRLVGTAWATTAQGRLRVSVSIGVALAMPQDTPAALIERADRAMLAAKAHGRNRVRMAPPPRTR